MSLPSGLTTLQECASVDVTDWEGLDEDSLLKLKGAIKNLKGLKVLLQARGLGAVFPVVVMEGYSSKEALYSMKHTKAIQACIHVCVVHYRIALNFRGSKFSQIVK